MISHFLRIIGITILLVICMFLPFIPGDYDVLAVTLSFMSRVLGWGGLLLVPIGFLWLIYETMKRRKKDWKHANKTHHFAIAALVVASIVAIAASLSAFLNNNRSFGIITLVVCIYIETVAK